MSTSKARGVLIRKAIVNNLEGRITTIVPFISKKFGVSRQAVNKHMRHLQNEGIVNAVGNTKNRKYLLASKEVFSKSYDLVPGLEEDLIWRDDISPALGEFQKNVLDLWTYVFTEMFNNAIDHSSGSTVFVSINKTAINTSMVISDNGEGIFKKIQRELKLHDERHAVLELSKGKLTTDPTKHSGEGIFFSSRAVDSFTIISGLTYFSHDYIDDRDWIMERKGDDDGTYVLMTMKNDAKQTLKELFDKFTSADDDFGFTKTVVPVRLAQYGKELLVSRSQAKRLLARIEKFKTVLFDFEGVDQIGQAFADEIFRVFQSQNKSIEIMPLKANKEIQKMINRVLPREMEEK